MLCYAKRQQLQAAASSLATLNISTSGKPGCMAQIFPQQVSLTMKNPSSNLIHGSVGLQEFAFQVASRSVDPFLHSSRFVSNTQTHRQTTERQ